MAYDRGAVGSVERFTFCALCVSVAATTLGELLALRGVVPEIVADRVKYAGMLALPRTGSRAVLGQ